MEVRKNTVSVVLPELASGEAVALETSCKEDLGVWVGEIAEYLEGAEGAVSFVELMKGLGMPLVAIWLGVLLGGFRVEQRGGFYGGEVWVECF